MGGFLGSGDLYLDRLTDAGVSTGLVKVAHATKFALKVESEVKEQTSRGRETYGQTIDSVSLIKGTSVSIELSQIDNDALAMIFMGDVAALAVTGASVTDESHIAHLGKSCRLTRRNVSAVVVTDSTGVTTHVEDTDYTVDTRIGLVTPLVGGAISEDDEILVDFTFASESGQTIKGATKPTVRVSMYLDGKNQVDGSIALVDVWDAKLTSETEVDFLADSFATFAASGSMVTPTGKTYPFEINRPV